MATGGVLASVGVLAVVVLVVVFAAKRVTSRRRDARSGPAARVRPERPCTVADLVRLRAEQAAAAADLPRRVVAPEPSSGEAVASPEPVEPPDPAEPVAAEPVVAEPVAAEPADAATAEPTTVAIARPDPPVPTRPARLIPLPAPMSSDTEPPWIRAARLTEGVEWDQEPDPGPLPQADVSDRAGSRAPRLSPQERAAEQAAADRALKRTFGLPETSAVALLAPDATGEHPLVRQKNHPRLVRVRARRRDGEAIAEAAIALVDDRGQETVSDSADDAGRGEVLAPHAGEFVLVVRAPGYQPAAVAVSVLDEPIDAEVQLTRSASLHGRAHGAGGSGPVHVVLWQNEEIVAEMATGPDGAYRFDDLVAGEYKLVVTVDGGEPVTAAISLDEGVEAVHDLAAGPGEAPSGV